LWWAPAPACFPILLVALRFVGDTSLKEAAGLAAVFSLAGLFGSYLRFKRDSAHSCPAPKA
jgi:hypothetical protein